MRSLALLVLLASCTADAPAAPSTCKGATYDVCRDEHDCTSQNCRPFGSIQVCTVGCDPDNNPCPDDKDGNAVTCTNNTCTPTVANDCSLP